MSVDYAAIEAAIYARAASTGAGSAFRATLGGASSVFPVRDLARYRDPQTPAGVTRPPRVWAVWRSLTIGGESGGMRAIGGSWWIYDDPDQGTYRINTTISALEALYGAEARYALTGGRTRVVYIGPLFEDSALGLSGRELRLTFDRRA